MTTPAPLPLPHQSRADPVTLSETDLTEIAGFIAAQSGRIPEWVESHLRWFLLENPARSPEYPLGFGLRSAGQLVGCILISPQWFRVGADKILFMGSSSFYVDEHYRGQGGRIFLQYCRLGKQWPLFGTSANAEAAALWKAAGASPIPYSDEELFGVLHWPPVAEEFVPGDIQIDCLPTQRALPSPISLRSSGH
jgi:GNAT superfamily N-acetyltransferase